MKHDDARHLSRAGEPRQRNYENDDYDDPDQLNFNYDDDPYNDDNHLSDANDDKDEDDARKQVSSNEAVLAKAMDQIYSLLLANAFYKIFKNLPNLISPLKTLWQNLLSVGSTCRY